MKMNKVIALLLCVAVIVAAGWYKQSLVVTKVGSGKRTVSSSNVTSKPDPVLSSKASTGAKTKDKLTSAAGVQSKRLPDPDFKLADRGQLLQKLIVMKQIQQKVFKTDAELAQRNDFVRDRLQLQNLALLLTNRQSLTAASDEVQAIAIDMLIEASQSGDRQYAEEIILEIIRDGKIETETEDVQVRKSLAGIKAELMYHAVGIDNRTVQNSISGPVTQKIWDNVQQAQADNVTESQIERRAQVAQQSR